MLVPLMVLLLQHAQKVPWMYSFRRSTSCLQGKNVGGTQHGKVDKRVHLRTQCAGSCMLLSLQQMLRRM